MAHDCAKRAGITSPTRTRERRNRGKWCGREDSNFHGLAATTTSTLRVYQFRHDRTQAHFLRAASGSAFTAGPREEAAH